MKVDLSVRTIAGVLALLGAAGATSACSKRDAASNAASPEPQALPSATAAAPAPKPVATALERDQPVLGGGSAASASAAPGASAEPKKDKDDGVKRRMTGQASCGAGNCATDPKTDPKKK